MKELRETREGVDEGRRGKQQEWKKWIQCHMALQHEEFQNDMVYLLLFGARRCLSFELGTIGEMLGHGSYVKIFTVAIGSGMVK